MQHVISGVANPYFTKYRVLVMLCNPLLRQFPLRKEFSRLHGISAVCNLAVFGGGVVLVILL